MLTDEQLRAMVPDLELAVKQHVQEQVIHGLQNSISWQLQETLGKCVKEFLEKEIVPEVNAQLLASKNGLRKAIIDATAQMSQTLSEAMVKRFTDNMNGYLGSDILKKMFS